MEVLENYVDFLFKDLPQCERISVAKQELLCKIQKKYEECVKNGKSESEAVGFVISEYKDLKSAAIDLGIADFFKSEEQSNSNKCENANNANVQKQKITTEIVHKFLDDGKKTGLMRAVGIALFILSVCPLILFNFLHINEIAGVFFMFLFIAAGVLLCVFSNSSDENLLFLKTESCVLQEDSKNYLKEKKHKNLKTYQISISAGVLLFVASIFPMMIMNAANEIAVILFFVFIATGVCLIVYASTIQNNIKKLLNIESNISNVSTDDKKSGKMKSVYWQTVTCIYLVLSFLTYRWDISWLIWPIAAVGFTLLKTVFSDDRD